MSGPHLATCSPAQSPGAAAAGTGPAQRAEQARTRAVLRCDGGLRIPGNRALLLPLGRLQHLSQVLPRVHTCVCGSAGNAGHGSFLLLRDIRWEDAVPPRPRTALAQGSRSTACRVGGPRPADPGRRLQVTWALDQGRTRWAAWPLFKTQHWPQGCVPAHPRTSRAQATRSITTRRLCCAAHARSSEGRRLWRIPPVRLGVWRGTAKQ